VSSCRGPGVEAADGWNGTGRKQLLAPAATAPQRVDPSRCNLPAHLSEGGAAQGTGGTGCRAPEPSSGARTSSLRGLPDTP